MIGSKPKYPKVTTPLAVCLDGHVNARDEVFREGDRVASSHPDVVANALFWADDGLPTAKYQELRQARLGPLFERNA